MKHRSLLLALGIILLLSACSTEPMKTVTEPSIENSREIATNFILNSPTYKFDGSELKLMDSNTLRCDKCFIYVFEFKSKYIGYGDRTSKNPKQKSTQHIITVVIQDKEVIQAIVDNTWNEIKQREILDYEIIDGEKVEKIPIYYCTEPRPKNCEKENESVCGSNKILYMSPCFACQYAGVKWYTKSACEKGYTDKAIDDLIKGKVTKESSTLLIMVGGI